MKTNDVLPYSTPESQGISSRHVLEFIEAVNQQIHELHSLMLVRHGQVVAEGWWAPYTRERPHMLFSLSKSFTSTAIGLAVKEGRLSIDDHVVSFFPEQCPKKISRNLAAMRVRDLLSMSTGHAQDTTGRMGARRDGDWVKGFLSLGVKYRPGTHFVYNSGATYMLSAILQKLTGITLLDYLTPRLFEPLGIDHPTWECCPRGINTGGWGLSIRTEDIARFGQLYLQTGQWQGRQIIPEDWIAQATSFQIQNSHPTNPDWAQGYGFQFWRCQHHAYRGDGAFGQYCIVMPDQDAVIAITSGVSDMQSVLNLVWKHLLPAMKDAPLPNEPEMQATLRAALSGLALPTPSGARTTTTAQAVSGKVYRFAANSLKIKTMTFDFSNGCLLKVEDAIGSHALDCHTDTWQENQTSLNVGPSRGRVRPMGGTTQNRPVLTQPVFAGCTWKSEDSCQVILRWIETPFFHTVNCQFMDHRVFINISTNVGFSPDKSITLEGSCH